MTQKITVNMASESEISVQGHGVHTAYEELASALEARDDITLIRGGFGKKVTCDVYHLHTVGAHMWRKLFAKHTPKVVSAHVIPASFIGSVLLAEYWQSFAKWYLRTMYSKADKVLAVSKTVADVLVNELHISPEKVSVLYNTIDMSRYHTTPKDMAKARQNLGIANDTFVVVGIGQVQPRKRLDTFIAMAQALPNVQFYWVGGIPFKQLGAKVADMKRLMSSTPKNLTITDVIPHEKVREYLQSADVFCLPAEQENHPMCVLEAAGAGLPIVLRDIPEYDDTFADDALRCADDEAFIAAILQFQSSEEVRQKYRQNSAKIAQRFDSKSAAGTLKEMYKTLIDEQDAR